MDHRVHHARAWLARCTVNGVAASDFMDLIESITRWEDWCKAWSERAATHEEMGRAALKARQFVSAAEHLSRAAVTYHYGKYLFVNDMAQMKAAHKKAIDCLDLALPHLDPPGERVMIPYEGKHLAGTLRLPKGVTRPPVVLMTMGLDSTKEELLTFEKNFLDRGMAILAFDGPGQGEAEYDFPIRYDYENVIGPVIDWLTQRGDVDVERVGVWGISLGGYGLRVRTEDIAKFGQLYLQQGRSQSSACSRKQNKAGLSGRWPNRWDCRTAQSSSVCQSELPRHSPG